MPQNGRMIRHPKFNLQLLEKLQIRISAYIDPRVVPLFDDDSPFKSIL